jgi:anaerobic selenocysteine-containing dehydrogenase
MTQYGRKVIRTTCSYCSTGCNLDAHLKDGRLESLRPAADYPVNLGKSCPKGFHLLTPFQSPDRALTRCSAASAAAPGAGGLGHGHHFRFRFKGILGARTSR